MDDRPQQQQHRHQAGCQRVGQEQKEGLVVQEAHTVDHPWAHTHGERESGGGRPDLGLVTGDWCLVDHSWTQRAEERQVRGLGVVRGDWCLVG